MAWNSREGSEHIACSKHAQWNQKPGAQNHETREINPECIAFALNPDNWTTRWSAMSFDAKAIRGFCEKKIKKFGSGAPEWRFF